MWRRIIHRDTEDRRFIETDKRDNSAEDKL